MDTLYSIDEVVLIPAVFSRVRSRLDCDVYYNHNDLPIFIAPMSCLVDEENYDKFRDKGFNVILPRTVNLEERLSSLYTERWVAVGLDEISQVLDLGRKGYLNPRFHICIDVANGHQSRIFGMCQELKKNFPNCVIMVGNIANPLTYKEYAKIGVDYVRLGIGSGQVCTTSVQTGIHYPMASLIANCKYLKEKYKLKTAIVADGGFRFIDQIVKGIALGADYVMIGRIAAGFPEACGEIRLCQSQTLPPTWHQEREYYGMSTEKAQKLMHPEPNYVPRHSEGTVRWIPVMSSTDDWIHDLTHALRSCMSYCDAFDLDEFKGSVAWQTQNPVTFNAYIKS